MSVLIQRLSALDPAPPWGIFSALNTVLVALVAIIAGSFIALTIVGETAYTAIVASTIGLLLATGFVLVSRREPAEREALRLGDTDSRLFLVFLFALGMAILIDFIAVSASGLFLPVPELTGLLQRDPGIVGWLLAASFMLVVQPTGEELVFRGVFFPAARHALGAWGGLLICALVYALFHYIAYAAPDTNIIYALVSPLLAGLVLSGVRAYTGSTRAAILAHMAFGLFALLKLLFLL